MGKSDSAVVLQLEGYEQTEELEKTPPLKYADELPKHENKPVPEHNNPKVPEQKPASVDKVIKKHEPKQEIKQSSPEETEKTVPSMFDDTMLK
jgi:hypothetical protein